MIISKITKIIFPRKIFKNNFRYGFSLLFSTSLIIFTLFLFTIQTDLFNPYYLIGYPSYTFITNDEVNLKDITLPKCNPFNSNSHEFKVKIDDDFYPKIVPLFLNKTINFTCLNSNPKKKTILLWNKYIGSPIISINKNESENLFSRSNCPVTNCEIILDRSKANESDLILFHMRSRIDKFPSFRFSNQRWVYAIYESQQHCPMCSKLSGLFNLSSTFRSESDITSIYLSDSKLEWVENNPNFNESNYSLERKSGFAVILISDCSENLKRIELVKELRKYIPVDIYGKCSDQNLKCPKDLNCRKYLSNNYKFFFAFENSICNGYVTEKFFDTLNYNILPVVLGAGDYTSYVPRSSYINLLDFPNLEDLSNYLIYLSKNQTAYLEFFKWKRFISTESVNRTHTNLCEMCIRLQVEDFTGIESKIFQDHPKTMGMTENCKAIKFKNIKNRKFIQLTNSPDYLKMRYLESF